MIRHGRRFGVVSATLVGLLLPLSSAASAAPFAYVKGGTKVSVIDVATNTVTTTIPIPQADYGAAVTPSGAKLIVTSYYVTSISVINTATNTVSATIPGFTSPISVAFSPDETKAYVVDYGAAALRVVNLLTNTIVATIPVQTAPWGVAVNPAGTRAYVANETSGTVSVIDLSTNTVITNVATGFTFPIGVAVSPDGSRFYVTNNLDGHLTVFNAATNAVITNITNGGTFGVAVNASGSRVYTTFGNTVKVIDTSTNTVTATITVGTGPYGIALTPDGTRLYVQNDTSNSVSVINTATNAVIATITPADGIGQYSLGLFIGPMCPSGCSDGNVCTGDTCNMVAGCSSSPTAGSCDDGIFCNGVDACSGGSCVHPGDPCSGGGDCSDTCNETADNCLDPVGTACMSDSNVCTDDKCNAIGECTHPANSAGCDDGSFCNGTDTCGGTTCSSHTGDPCVGPDGDADCTESCDEAADACTAADPNGSACADGQYCNGTDTCSGGSCVTHTGDPCPGVDSDVDCSESCDESADNCGANDPNGSACSDSAFCNGTDSCSSGSCSVHTGDPCPGVDGDADCSEECNEAADNCTMNDPNGSECDDTAFCNGTDTCSGGTCAVHTGDPCPGVDGDIDCSETCNELGDDCTANDPNGSACADSEFCNGTDTCSGGSCANHSGDPCAGGPECADTCSEASDNCLTPGAVPCGDDGQPCTVDECDGTGACLHPAGNAGAQCRAGAGQCDVAETCDGASTTCPLDAVEPDGTMCDDSAACTIDDECTAGTCGGSSITCGDGTLQSECNEACDDGDVLNDDGCSDTCELEPCKPLPDNTCKSPFVGAKASIKLRNDADDTRDSMQWKWIKGSQTDKDEFGDPIDTDSYWLCVYDDGQLVSTTEVTAGGTCDGNPCWSESGSGFKFKSKSPTTDGATGVKLGAGSDGKAKALLKAKGAGVDVPALPPLGALTVQLVNATSGVCWTATYSPPFAKEDGVSLSDRSD